MFIGWISQMLPLMDKPEGEAVEDILHSIATTYPQVYTYFTVAYGIAVGGENLREFRDG